jgi:hypothetical protein
MTRKEPKMSLFVRVFLAVAAVLLALVVLAFVLKLLIVAAVIAALVFGGILAATAVRRALSRPKAYPMRRL